MSKYFNKKGQLVNGNWKKKKVRLPRKVKKWLKLLEIQNKNFSIKFKFFKPTNITVWKTFAEYRGQRKYLFGNSYYKRVIKYKNL